MRRNLVYLGLASLALVAASFTPPQERVVVRDQADRTPAAQESSGEEGCSGCFCCFPRTPDGNVSLNGFAQTSAGETVLYTVPHGKWFMVTDIEVVALDGTGQAISREAFGLFEIDRMGMMGTGLRTMKRWANCSPYHSARGIPFMPMCDVTLDRIQVGTQTATDRVAVQVYYQINGYLWDDAGSSSSHSH